MLGDGIGHECVDGRWVLGVLGPLLLRTLKVILEVIEDAFCAVPSQIGSVHQRREVCHHLVVIELQLLQESLLQVNAYLLQGNDSSGVSVLERLSITCQSSLFLDLDLAGCLVE